MCVWGRRRGGPGWISLGSKFFQVLAKSCGYKATFETYNLLNVEVAVKIVEP